MKSGASGSGAKGGKSGGKKQANESVRMNVMVWIFIRKLKLRTNDGGGSSSVKVSFVDDIDH
jgi:hypothetical protein